MSVFDKINQCSCGSNFKQGDKFCSNCGRPKYRMNDLPDHTESVEKQTMNAAKAEDLARKFGTFQVARSRSGR